MHFYDIVVSVFALASFTLAIFDLGCINSYSQQSKCVNSLPRLHHQFGGESCHNTRKYSVMSGN